MLPLIYKSDISYVKNKRIYEYDMASGGFSVSLSEGLVKEPETVKELITASKKHRQIILGNYTKRDREFTKNLHQGFQKYINAFIEYNEIDVNNVLTVKKDSILYYGLTPIRTKFKKVNFTLRGEFTSYLRLGQIELFYNGRTKERLVKGISLKSIEETLLDAIFTLLALAENRPQKDVVNFLTDIRQSYINLDLTNNYYRELSVSNKYKLKDGISTFDLYIDEMESLDLDITDIDIEYNYVNIIVPLCSIFV